MMHPFSGCETKYRLVTRDGIRSLSLGGHEFLEISPQTLTRLSAEAFHDASFFLRSSHLEQWLAILADRNASDADKFVVGTLLKNAVIAGEGVLPLCQDTGTATVIAKRGERVLTGGEDERWLTAGIAQTFETDYLRYSQIAPRSMFDEVNTQNNLPAQIDIGFASGAEYHLLFMAKGGGSSNKTGLFQESKALLTPGNLEAFLRDRIGALGVAACPPYHLAIVIGGSSPEANLKMLKLATVQALDGLPTSGDDEGRAFRDLDWERRVLKIAGDLGLGAQFGGRWLALDARVVRLSRHAGSCPVSIGVSCSAHRNVLGSITADGAFLEGLDKNPARHLGVLNHLPDLKAVSIDLETGMDEVRTRLATVPVGGLLRLCGNMVVARDAAHARLYEMLLAGKSLPDYFKRYPVYYAGPAKSPPGMPIGSFGPTTAQRMDEYLETFMRQGASLITLAKGNRSSRVTEACRAHGGFYLGTIGGAAALLAQDHIVSSEVLDFPELGMEAVRRITVRDLPAFMIVDNQGRNLYA